MHHYAQRIRPALATTSEVADYPNQPLFGISTQK